MLSSKQKLIAGAFDLTLPLLDKSLAEELSQINIEDMDAFQAAWTEWGSQRCQGLELDFEKQTLFWCV